MSDLLTRLPAGDVVTAHPTVEREQRILRGMEALRRLPQRELDQVVLRDMGVDLRSFDHETALRKAAELGTASVRCTDTRAANIAVIPQPITAVPVEESAYLRSHGGWPSDKRERVIRGEPGDADHETQDIGARPIPYHLRGW